MQITVHPTPDPVITANRRTTLCLDETITLSAPEGFVSYRWSNGSTDREITTGEAGTYTVTVVDSFGCVGTSEPVTVEVLNTRNKIEVQFSAGNDVVVPEHHVGELSCTTLLVRNRSTAENLVITSPTMLGNVFCSAPLGQFPITIAPLAQAELTVCCSAIDTGLVRDTLVLSDTCSPTMVPIRSRGTEILFESTSRCDVPVQAVVYRAGTAHRLSAPFPMPASEGFELGVTPPAPMQGILLNTVGRQVRTLRSVMGADRNILTCDTRDLPSGMYQVVVIVDNEHVQRYPVLIVR